MDFLDFLYNHNIKFSISFNPTDDEPWKLNVHHAYTKTDKGGIKNVIVTSNTLTGLFEELCDRVSGKNIMTIYEWQHKQSGLLVPDLKVDNKSQFI